MSSKDNTAAGSQKTIELLKPHTHAGRDYPVGAVLTMDADSADWLISLKSAQPSSAQTTQEG